MGSLLLQKRQSWKSGYLLFIPISLLACVVIHKDEPLLALLLAAGGVAALGYILTSASTVYSFHEQGLLRRRFGRAITLHYRDVARLTLEITRHYHGSHHSYTDYQLRLDGLRAFFRVPPSDAKLQTALEPMVEAVADRLDQSGDIPWGQSARLTAAGVEGKETPRLLQKPQTVLVPYEQITALGFDGSVTQTQQPGPMKTSVGHRQLQLRGATSAEVVRIDCSEENFYPGYQVLRRRLGARMRSLPPPASLSP